MDTSMIPKYLMESDDAWETIQRLAQLTAGVGEDRHMTGSMFGTSKWTPGCQVCALGCAFEQLMPEEELAKIDRSDARIYDRLWEAYKHKFGAVSRYDFSSACSAIVSLNDRAMLTLPEIRQLVQEAYDEHLATRTSTGPDQHDDRTGGGKRDNH